MYTPSGRFETGERICLSMSDYHPETCNPSWGVRTILLGLYTFMIDDDFSDGTIGSIKDTYENRKHMALSSYDYNKSNKYFEELYEEFIILENTTSVSNDEKAKCRYCFESS